MIDQAKDKLPDDLQSAPSDLSEESRHLFAHVVSTGEYDGPARVLVIQFLQARDTATAARKELLKSGRTFRDRWGQLRESPWAKIDREAVRDMSRIFRSLGWDQAPPAGQMDLWGGAPRR
jgi:hypothetical protein